MVGRYICGWKDSVFFSEFIFQSMFPPLKKIKPQIFDSFTKLDHKHFKILLSLKRNEIYSFYGWSRAEISHRFFIGTTGVDVTVTALFMVYDCEIL